MTNKSAKSTSDAVIQRLVRETGLTEDQARDLVSILGIPLSSSLVREARLLNRSP